MNSITLTAPAKVNLFLKVLNKRKDSYHNILTLFERISLADTVTVSKAPRGISVVSDRPITARPADNIAYKAAELILKRAGIKSGVKIRIKKRIPIAAGLGGGSSDAAAVLSCINELFDLNIGKGRLMRLGAELGADVPFFLFNVPFAIGKSRGDRLEALNIGKKFWHILVYPGFKVATKDVYRAFDASASLSINPEHSRRVDFALTRKYGDDKMAFPKDWDRLGDLIHNDLGAVVVRKRPVIGKVIKCLVSSLDKKTIVSGSGPSVFCLYRTRKEAIRARRRLSRSVPAASRRGWQVFIVGTQS